MKILIIEDDEKLAKMVKTFLGREGFTTDYITDGESGARRAFLHHRNYDLLVLDLMLPGKNGAEICKEIREKGISIPILVLTAKSSVEDKVTLLNLGADDYLVKPFSLKELLARVHALVRRPKENLPQEFKISDLTLNPVTRKVFRAGKEVKLTLKEFRLLEYLIRNADQVVEREQILDNLWGFDFDSFSNIIDVHMKNLRRKIDTKSSNKPLETIRGVGYRINAS